MPDRVRDAAVTAYREALGPALPAVADDAAFAAGLADAAVWWAVVTDLDRDRAADRLLHGGVLTGRQWAVQRITVAAGLAAAAPALPETATALTRLAAALQQQWRGVPPLGGYPALPA